MSICTSCQYALEEETQGYEFDQDMIEFIATELGSDVSDHICDAREYPSNVSPCDCTCNTN